ncbi:hypothetical protein L7F22_047830 [Adiantum nelumboides]|nr:hypothetical protein [Adiantum nelumboides]
MPSLARLWLSLFIFANAPRWLLQLTALDVFFFWQATQPDNLHIHWPPFLIASGSAHPNSLLPPRIAHHPLAILPALALFFSSTRAAQPLYTTPHEASFSPTSCGLEASKAAMAASSSYNPAPWRLLPKKQRPPPLVLNRWHPLQSHDTHNAASCIRPQALFNSALQSSNRPVHPALLLAAHTVASLAPPIQGNPPVALAPFTHKTRLLLESATLFIQSFKATLLHLEVTF